jgi:hypothetical protein
VVVNGRLTVAIARKNQPGNTIPTQPSDTLTDTPNHDPESF